MKERRYRILLWSLTLAIVILTAVLALLRLFHGAEMTDEALAVGDAYLAARGGLPLVNMWSQFSTIHFITAPIVQFYLWLSGGTAGIMLYMRLMFFLWKILLIALMCLLLRKSVSLRLLLLSSAFLLPMDYCNLQNFTYTIVSIHCLLAASACISSAFLDDFRTRGAPSARSVRSGSIKAIAGGIFAALCAAAYPPQAITCGLLAVGLLCMEWTFRRSVRFTVCFAGSGAGVALWMILFLAVRSGGLSPLINGIGMVLHVNPYTSLKTTSTWTLLFSQVRSTIRELFPFVCLLLLTAAVSLTAYGLLVRIGKRKSSSMGKAVFLFPLWLSYAAYQTATGPGVLPWKRVSVPFVFRRL